jgi:hypothetical protein
MVESPRLCADDVSQEPGRLLTGLADSMTAMCSWNMHARTDMVMIMGPQHAKICADAGLSRADVHRKLCEIAGRKVRELKGGGNWRRERALRFPIKVDPDDDDCWIPTIKDPNDLQLIVAGGWAHTRRSVMAGVAAAAAQCMERIRYKQNIYSKHDKGQTHADDGPRRDRPYGRRHYGEASRHSASRRPGRQGGGAARQH